MRRWIGLRAAATAWLAAAALTAAGGLAAAQSFDFSTIEFPDLRDPFLAGGAAAPICADIPENEREKVDCVGGAGPGAALFATIEFPPLRDPFANLAPGAALSCAEVPEAEREKVDCGAPGGPSGSSIFSDETARAFPPIRDPYAAEGSGPPSCAIVPAADREKITECVQLDPLAEREDERPDGRRPMPLEEFPDLDRRVLTLPGARLALAPGAALSQSELPAFSIYYVYDEQRQPDGSQWVEVGLNAFGETDGWLRADHVEDWRSMLVMEFAPKGQRDRVLFFKERNELISFVRDPFLSEEAKFLYDQVSDGTFDRDYLTAIEPATGVSPDSTYLMPILDFKRDNLALGDPVTLVQVAGLNLDPSLQIQNDVRDVENFEVSRRARELRGFKIGVTFVIDTTQSMGPYIDKARNVVTKLYDAVSRDGLLDNLSFGLIGYRDNMDHEAEIEYVTRVYQPLDVATTPEELLRNFSLMGASSVSTLGFDEDAFAALEYGLSAMDWEPFDLRLIILITDAGARSSYDPLAAVPNFGAINVRERADSGQIALSVVHLETPEGRAAGNVETARTIYRDITRTGDPTFDKYIALDATDASAFDRNVESFASTLSGAMRDMARGSFRAPEDAPSAAPTSAPSLGDVLVNELFRAQLEFLGAERGQQPPRFYRAWAADRDLRNPTASSLDVKVFLTRNQLSALSQGVEAVLDAYQRQETGGGDFFDALQQIAAQTAVVGGPGVADGSAADLMPSFLKILPYRSEVLALTRQGWRSRGPQGQSEFIFDLRSKLKEYREISGDRKGWIDLGTGDRGLDVYDISLDILP